MSNTATWDFFLVHKNQAFAAFGEVKTVVLHCRVDISDEVPTFHGLSLMPKAITLT
jgi:hypothetical protein